MFDALMLQFLSFLAMAIFCGLLFCMFLGIFAVAFWLTEKKSKRS